MPKVSCPEPCCLPAANREVGGAEGSEEIFAPTHDPSLGVSDVFSYGVQVQEPDQPAVRSADADFVEQLQTSLAALQQKPATKREADLEFEIQRLKGIIESMWKERGMNAQDAEEKSRPSKNSNASFPSLAPDAEELDQVIASASASEASDAGAPHPATGMARSTTHGYSLDATTNVNVLLGSALSMRLWKKSLIYLIALGGVVFVLIARATHLADPAYAADAAGDAAHRRLGGDASLMLIQVAFSLATAGLTAFLVALVNLPLILGYLVSGVLVGPYCMDIVHSLSDIQEFSSLGLVFLLFMIGLELDVSELLKMGRVVIGTGLFQFPLCAVIMTGIFMGLEAIPGFSFGEGDFAAVYVGVPCAISSTMIVVKLLAEHAEMDTAPGRLTVGILIFQDIWAIVVLAIQPDLKSPQVLGILFTFGMIIALIVIALWYAKFVMPAIFTYSSRSVELMLMVALAWCFFMCALATLPFVGLSMELAPLISGVALATFPYSAEFNGKIKYIRDFFITLFFVGLGMQIPPPTFAVVGQALLIAFTVLVVRWIGIFLVVYMLGGGDRLAAVSTINLSQISEFALVICSLGKDKGHIKEDTLTVIIWTFSIMAILSSVMIGKNYQLYGLLCRASRRVFGRKRNSKGDTREVHEEGGDHVDRNIVLLGFHKVAAMLIAHFEHHNANFLAKVHVIDFHEHLMPQLRKRGVTCAYGDISSADVLEHAHHGDVQLVISSIPDSMLRGVSNMRLLQISKQVWPQADFIGTADTPQQAHDLYEAGADYVLRMAKLCAERLHSLISDHSTHAAHHHHVGQEVKLDHVFAEYKSKDSQVKDHAMRV